MTASSRTSDHPDAGPGSLLARWLHIAVSILTWLSWALMLLVPVWFLVATLGTKWGFLSWQFGLGVMVNGWGPTLLLTSLVTGMLALLVIGLNRLVSGQLFGVIMAPAWAVLIGAAGLGWNYTIVEARAAVPALLDITTDRDDPPHFSTGFESRRDRRHVSLDYTAHRLADGRSFAAAQAVHYPDIVSWQTTEDPDAVYRRAIGIGRYLGWHIGTASQSAGMFEANVESFWFGLRDDVVVRVRAGDEGGSRVDIRSVAREPVHDLGRNADRVSEFLERLQSGETGL